MPRDFPRSRRIEDQIQRLLSDLIRTEVRDPRLAKAVITAVRITRDLSVAWVYYTVLQSDGNAPSLQAAFESAGGFLRSRLARDLTLRRVPELRFELDASAEHGRAMDRLIGAAMDADRDTKPTRSADNDESE
jgi:ribosome-binding factor A